MSTLKQQIEFYTGKKLDTRKIVLVKEVGEDIKIESWEDEKPEPTIAELNALDSQADIYHNDIATKKATDKANANQKLKDLGLTDDEIKAIKGIK